MQPDEDVILLKEAVAAFPWDVPCNKQGAVWESLVKAPNLSIDPERHLDVHRARERLSVLLAKHKSNEVESLQASGTDEDFTERMQLLTDLTEMIHDETDCSQAAKQDREDEEKQGEFLRKAAMEGMQQNSDLIDNESSGERSKWSKLMVQKKGKIIEIEERLESFIEDGKLARKHEAALLQLHELEERRQEIDLRCLELDEMREKCYADQQLQMQNLMLALANNLQSPN